MKSSICSPLNKAKLLSRLYSASVRCSTMLCSLGAGLKLSGTRGDMVVGVGW